MSPNSSVFPHAFSRWRTLAGSLIDLLVSSYRAQRPFLHSPYDSITASRRQPEPCAGSLFAPTLIHFYRSTGGLAQRGESNGVKSPSTQLLPVSAKWMI